MTEQERVAGRSLHERTIQGETLTPEEMQLRDAYYAVTDSHGATTAPAEDRLAQGEARNAALKALVERSEAFAAYLQSVVAAAQAEREALDREFRRIAA